MRRGTSVRNRYSPVGTRGKRNARTAPTACDRIGSRSTRNRTKIENTMDWWLRGRIIYTYLLWVVFKVAAAGGFYGECSLITRDSSTMSGYSVIPWESPIIPGYRVKKGILNNSVRLPDGSKFWIVLKAIVTRREFNGTR